MGLPRSLTLPAELCFASTAHHVITAAILLNGGVALWALLCVAVDPVGGLAVVVTLLQPQLQVLTLDRLMRLSTAPETEEKEKMLVKP